MQEKHLYEYAVIRIVPCVEKEEFINAGIVLYCSAQKFLDVVFELNEAKLSALNKNIDISEIEQRLNSFSSIARGEKNGGMIATFPPASRFRWLAAAKSTVLQTSPVHPGLCVHPYETMMQLFQKLVLT